MQQKNHRSISLLLFWKCVLLICLPLWTLPTFFKIKNVWKTKNVKKRKKRDQNKKRKTFFTFMARAWSTQSKNALFSSLPERGAMYCDQFNQYRSSTSRNTVYTLHYLLVPVTHCKSPICQQTAARICKDWQIRKLFYSLLFKQFAVWMVFLLFVRLCNPGAEFTIYLTIYRKIIASLS